ncbi:MAG: carboxypeptidase regulatory-like domain-containing protein [Acidobacteria bacterium]|nr:carboxypeptidase regulatory-like domain-containing protein [Acidobacteriota bacterium]
MRRQKRIGRFMVGGLGAAAAAVLALAATPGAVQPPDLTADGEDLAGVVQSPAGPEAGIWVIAETDDLDTRFRKIVVTGDDGRFLVPDLPAASYRVWVRGYGLVDSEPVTAQPGETLTLQATPAATPAEAAQVYPANYWYSLLEPPPPSEFPGTGPEGNGIAENLRSQAAWVDLTKQGCQLCHQMGNRFTFDTSHLTDFDSTVAAWDHRLLFGQRGRQMSAVMNRFGRERGLEMYADWSDRIAAGEVPPAPPRPRGVERNLVLTMWEWGGETSYIHDEITTDKRDPTVNGNGLLYGVSITHDTLVVTDPARHQSMELKIPLREPEAMVPSFFPTEPGFEPSPTWADEVIFNAPANPHNPMMDADGRVWMTSTVRRRDNPDWCKEGSMHLSAQYFPVDRSGRQISYYDPSSESFTLIDSCYGTHHLQFGEDEQDTLWLSGDPNVVGWLDTKLYDETGDERASQGWCPTVIDTNGDGRITRPWNEPNEPVDASRDTRIAGFAYGIIASPVDDSAWIARTGPFPGRLVRLDRGDNPPETCIAEVFEPPSIENPAVDPAQTGHAPRGVDVDRNGLIWTALSGSGHMASFDRGKCAVLNGPEATGQHCPEGWTLYPSPGPQMKGVADPGSADYHYYNWVDQFDTLGLGPNVPMAPGSGSDSVLALLPETGEWVVLRVPYPLGFYSRGLDGRIDDPDAGWKGRGLWANYGSNLNWHIEGGKGTRSSIIHFQLRPHPLAE